MDGIQFNWTLNLGHVINLSFMLVGSVGAFFLLQFNVRSIGWRITRLEAEIKNNHTEFKAMLAVQTEILTTIARQDERLKSMDRRLDVMDKR